MSAPPWLRDEPEIAALLAAVLDRLDEQPGDTRRHAIVVRVARFLVSLESNDSRADQTWEFIRELERAKVLSIRPGRRTTYDPQWHEAKLAFAPASESILREWLGRPAAATPMQQWRSAVEMYAQRFPGGHEILLNRRIAVDGRTAQEVVGALATLADLGGEATLRQLSTRAFWGDSKVLDRRADLIAALFPALQIRDRPVLVSGYLPLSMRGVLFIENEDTYVAAIRGQPPQTAGHALIYIKGFSGTAARIRSSEGACLHFGGPGRGIGGDEFERRWFDAAPLHADMQFWGDLDFASMQMLKTLRSRFGVVTAWRAGYEPMLADLRNRGVHPRLDAKLDEQVDPGATGCEFADTQLLPAIREHGFWHQERMAAG